MTANIKKKKSRKIKENQINEGVKIEVIILVTLAVCILLILSNFGMCGSPGNWIASVIFGLFGMLGWVVPIFLFIGIAFVCSNKGNRIAYVKVISGVILTICICSFIQMVTVSFKKSQSFLEYYRYASSSKRAGGLLGGILTKILGSSIGVVATFVIVVILAIICLLLITQRPFLKEFGMNGKRAYDNAKTGAMRKRNEAQARKQERDRKKQWDEDKRQTHKVSGVSFATTLAKKAPDVKELKAEEKEIAIQRANPMIDLAEKAPERKTVKEEDSVGNASPKAPVRKRRTAGEKTKEAQTETETVSEMIQQSAREQTGTMSYQFPPATLLVKGKKAGGDSDDYLRSTANKLEETLRNFGVNVTITNVSCGPSVTRYELQPEQGVKVSKIVGLSDDIKLNLAAADIRIEAPIPGKAAVGIEVPNKENTVVLLRDLIETSEFRDHPSRIAFAAGRDIAGKVVIADIQKMPHLLIAGATGSGKSVCINTLIMSILYRATPEEVKLLMIDPKVVELSVYNGIPHLMIPVVTDPKKAAGALNWAVAEMTRRYQVFAESNVRDLKGYNAKVASLSDIEDEDKPQKMPQIVIIVDELADLMMVAPGEVEGAICRLAQLARAAGIHLVLATQRPSVNVITGLIKANMPSRIAFSVTSGVDSRTIIDMNGAEKLLGKGDMLFYPTGYQKPVRVQGSFVSDKEVQKVVQFLLAHNEAADYDTQVEEHMQQSASAVGASMEGGDVPGERDVYFVEAGKFIIDKEKASIGMLQRMFKIGFNRAARIMDQLADAGVVGEEEGTKPRKVLMSLEQFEQYIEECL